MEVLIEETIEIHLRELVLSVGGGRLIIERLHLLKRVLHHRPDLGPVLCLLDVLEEHVVKIIVGCLGELLHFSLVVFLAI